MLPYTFCLSSRNLSLKSAIVWRVPFSAHHLEILGFFFKFSLFEGNIEVQRNRSRTLSGYEITIAHIWFDLRSFIWGVRFDDYVMSDDVIGHYKMSHFKGLSPLTIPPTKRDCILTCNEWSRNNPWTFYSVE